jgi:hypothetical protein
VTSEKKDQPERSLEVVEALRRIRELPAEQQELVLNGLQADELSRMSAGVDLLGSLSSSDELVRSLSSIQLSTPNLDEAAAMLLAAVDQRIDASNRLKDYIRTVVGPVTKERIREWRQQAKADLTSERYLRTCRGLYGTVLETSSVGERSKHGSPLSGACSHRWRFSWPAGAGARRMKSWKANHRKRSGGTQDRAPMRSPLTCARGAAFGVVGAVHMKITGPVSGRCGTWWRGCNSRVGARMRTRCSGPELSRKG